MYSQRRQQGKKEEKNDWKNTAWIILVKTPNPQDNSSDNSYSTMTINLFTALFPSRPAPQ